MIAFGYESRRRRDRPRMTGLPGRLMKLGRLRTDLQLFAGRFKAGTRERAEADRRWRAVENEIARLTRS